MPSLKHRNGRSVYGRNLTLTGNLNADQGTTTGSFALGSGDTVDLNGEADALVMDADGDTSISAPTDNQIDVEIAGADDFRFLANIFRALSGSSIEADAINETTAAAGVTIDSVQLKDGVVKRTPTVLSGDGAVTIPPGDTVFVITKASVCVLTIADPAVGDNGKVLKFISRTAQAHTLSNAAGSGFNAGGASADVATWGGAIGDGLELVADNAKWLVAYLRNVTLG